MWAKSFGGNHMDDGVTITVDQAGNFYLGAHFRNTVDADLSSGVFNLTSNGFGDVLISKNTPNGNLIWAKSYGGSDEVWPSDVTLDHNEDLIIVGALFGTADLNPGPQTNWITSWGNRDGYILKLTNSGQYLWSGETNCIGNGITEKVTTDQSGNIYAVGFMEQSGDIDPTQGVLNNNQGLNGGNYVYKLSPSGQLIWVDVVGSLGSTTYPHGMVFDQNTESVVFCGHYAQIADFAPGPSVLSMTADNGQDIFYTRWNHCSATLGSANLSECAPYTSYSGNQTWTGSGTYLDTLTNSAGCDSIMFVFFTALPPSASTMTANSCNTFTSPTGQVWKPIATR